MGCGDKVVRREEAPSSEEHRASKDDLSGSWSDDMEFRERTVSFINVEDPSHHRVTELQITHSILEESQVPDTDQEEDQRIHCSQGSADLSQDLLGSTKDQVGQPQPNRCGPDGHFVRCLDAGLGLEGL